MSCLAIFLLNSDSGREANEYNVLGIFLHAVVMENNNGQGRRYLCMIRRKGGLMLFVCQDFS